MMSRFGALELFIVEFILFAILWLCSDFLGTMFSLGISLMAFCILIISVIAELLEPSKVPRWYFTFMVVTIITPLLVAGIMIYIFEGKLDWMSGAGSS